MQTITFEPFPILTTTRLTLRQLNTGDDSQMFLLRSNTDVVKYLDRPVYETIDEARRFIQKINDGIARDEWILWAITLKPDNKLIGTICLWNIAPDEAKAEAGYELLPDHHGKGIMQEALRAVLQYGFETLKFLSIEAYVNPKNTPSIKLLKRNDFVHAGTVHESDDFDMEIYALTEFKG
jgi:ribosomal-protein-alanine N-acetyltransferase